MAKKKKNSKKSKKSKNTNTPLPKKYSKNRIQESKKKKQKHLPDAYRNDAKKLERNHLDSMSLKVHSVEADGNCLFRAFSHQLAATVDKHLFIRNVVCEYLAQHSERFSPFLEIPIEDYINNLYSPHSWAGQLELQILAEIFQVNIRIYQNDLPNQLDIFQFPISKNPPNTIYLSFHFGEHYNSVISTESGPIIGSFFKALDKLHPKLESVILSASLRKIKPKSKPGTQETSQNLTSLTSTSLSIPILDNIDDSPATTSTTPNSSISDDDGVPMSRAARRRKKKGKKKHIRGGVQSRKSTKKIQRTLDGIVSSASSIDNLKASVYL